MKYVYPACFYAEDDGRYSVIVPDFLLATYGVDLPDAMYMAQEAIAGRIFGNFEDGEALPTPSLLKDVRLEKQEGFVSLVYVDIDNFKKMFDEKPIKKTLTIPSWLNSAAERKRVNFSSILKEALLDKIAGIF